jgi:hypothetical protein
LFVSIVVLSIFSRVGMAEEIEKYEVVQHAENYGFMIGVGISSKYVSFDVYRAGESTPEGTLTEGEYLTFFLLLGSPYRYFGKSSFGYYFEMGYSAYNFDRQEIGDNLEDLRTSVNGSYFYLTPVLFYDFGNRRSQRDFTIKLGIGYGLGYLKASGDIIFTRDNQNTSYSYNINEWGEAFSMMLDSRYKQWIFRIIASGPEITKGDFEYNIFDISIDVGYAFHF